jgi:hypothetical protein
MCSCAGDAAPYRKRVSLAAGRALICRDEDAPIGIPHTELAHLLEVSDVGGTGYGPPGIGDLMGKVGWPGLLTVIAGVTGRLQRALSRVPQGFRDPVFLDRCGRSRYSRDHQPSELGNCKIADNRALNDRRAAHARRGQRERHVL